MLKQGLQQKLMQKLSPLQIQLMKLLEVPAASMEQRIKEELQTNPALEEGEREDELSEVATVEEDGASEEPEKEAAETDEEAVPETETSGALDELDEYFEDDDIPDYKLSVNNHSADDEIRETPLTSINSLMDVLKGQLGMLRLNERQLAIAEHLIGSLDDDGYLRRDLQSLADDLAFTQNVQAEAKDLEQVLEMIHTFDPAGIGARDLRECLLIQLGRNPHTRVNELATRIIRDYMEDFSRKHYKQIEQKLNISEEELRAVMHEIIRLNPKPGNLISGGDRYVPYIIPDFIINNRDGEMELSLNSGNVPDLRISRSYAEMLQERKKGKDQKEVLQFVKQKLDSAKWFIDAIRQRQETLMRTMAAIMHYQKAYFEEGDETKLRPMILKDIAEEIGMDISTVSRVANSKYVQTPFGTFLLKHFFSEGIQTEDGEEVSSREVKKILSDCISGEDKKRPLTDDRLAELLKEKGYTIARRTVAKYREQLQLPVARMRKEA